MSVPISILFATAQRPQLVKRTLTSLLSVEQPSHFQGIWVVENGTRTGVENIVQELASSLPVHYLFSPEPSKPAAMNLGFSHLPDSLVYLTDDDVRFYPQTLTALAAAAHDAPRNSYFGGPFDVDYEESPAEWLTPLLPFSARGWSRPPTEPTHLPRGRFLGFNWAAYRDDLEKLDGFNPAIGPGTTADSTGDESELQLRLRSHGIQSWYVPEMRLAHYVPRDRCSAEWAIERAYRHGVGWGQIHRNSLLRPLLTIKAACCWQWARRSRTIHQQAIAGEVASTIARYRESKWRGRLEGLRHRAA